MKKCLLIILLLLLTEISYSQFKEYEVKAIYLAKLSLFIDWPEESPVNKSTIPFNICVIGDNPFEDISPGIFSQMTIKKKNVIVRFIDNIKEINDCDLLFISSSEKGNMSNILSKVDNKSILIIGDTKGYLEKGVHINFYIREQGTVHFNINLKSATKAGIHIGLPLLQVADRIL